MDEEIERMHIINYFETFTSFERKKFDEILEHLYNYAIKYGLEDDDMSLITTVSFQENIGSLKLNFLLTKINAK